MYNDYLSAYSVLFAIKSQSSLDKENKDTLSSQYLFSKYFDKNFKKNKPINSKNFIFEPYKKVFLEFDHIQELKNIN